MSLRSPLARVLGAGSAKEGTDHWWHQRVTAVALALLGAWFLLSIASLDDFTQQSVVAWVAEPWNSVALLLLGATLAFHSSLGVQVVLEDYVHSPFLKVAALLVNKFIHVAVAAAASFAVLKVAVGAA